MIQRNIYKLCKMCLYSVYKQEGGIHKIID